MPDNFQQLIKRLSLRQLEVFYAVYQEKGFVKAAGKLGLTQPAVSSQIRQLEEALGQKVFEYIGRQLYYTPVGNLLAESIEVMFEQLRKLKNDIHTLEGKVSGDLKIAAVNTAQYIVPYLVKFFLEKYPQVRVSLDFVNQAQAIDKLLENQYDLVIMGVVPSDKPLSIIPFLDNGLIPVVHHAHPFTQKTSITAEQFFEQPLLIRERGAGSRQALEQYCYQNRIKLLPMIEVGSNEALKHAVLSELGVAVLPKLSVLSELSLGSLTELSIKGFPIKRSWCLVYPSTKSLSPVTQHFIQYVQSHLSLLADFFEEKIADAYG
ncbi:LysR family transcriptional regulator [Aliikangiella sp. IMCC44359]|uniref:LysR family transcriptional regulator n=1 Tax=Aliikangiella sp. IMCC44359 TaxID=3459125 RepID=UPI00403AA3C6